VNAPSGNTFNGESQAQTDNGNVNDNDSQPGADASVRDTGNNDEESAQDPAPVEDGTSEGMKRFQSPDGSRMVKITEDGDAFLYDTSDSPHPAKPQYLDSNVIGVEFTTAESGRMRIQLTLKDGTFMLFNRDGMPREEKSA
jgi:hypothetical protein